MDLFGFFTTSGSAIVSFVYSSPYGIVVLFLFALFANATIFFPILVEPVVLAIAALAPNVLVAVFVGVVAGVASGIGEMSGYILGLLGVKTLQKMSRTRVEKIFELGERLADRGIYIIFLGALTPFPFDLLGIAAGVIKYSPKKFFVGALGGKIVRYVLISVAGFYGLAWLKTVLGI